MKSPRGKNFILFSKPARVQKNIFPDSVMKSDEKNSKTIATLFAQNGNAFLFAQNPFVKIPDEKPPLFLSCSLALFWDSALLRLRRYFARFWALADYVYGPAHIAVPLIPAFSPAGTMQLSHGLNTDETRTGGENSHFDNSKSTRQMVTAFPALHNGSACISPCSIRVSSVAELNGYDRGEGLGEGERQQTVLVHSQEQCQEAPQSL
ncbi:MAG TPA: hypothetical protein VG754_05945 [Verrucomicrobiae bacterium]|nr:hypothetical protein [Verrucomicrobiae bacterium]